MLPLELEYPGSNFRGDSAGVIKRGVRSILQRLHSTFAKPLEPLLARLLAYLESISDLDDLLSSMKTSLDEIQSFCHG
jgi:hypothetical protein